MSLDKLRARIMGQCTKIRSGDEDWVIGKLTAGDSLYLQPLLSGAKDGENDDAITAGTLTFYAALLSKCLRDESGKRPYDSDEGRELLAELDRTVFMQLGRAALDFNYQDAKKNLSDQSGASQ